MKKTSLLPILFLLGAAPAVFATPLIGEELAKFSIVAGSYATYGAGAIMSAEVGAGSYITGDRKSVV